MATGVALGAGVAYLWVDREFLGGQVISRTTPRIAFGVMLAVVVPAFVTLGLKIARTATNSRTT